eukprot:TRINITY_DN37066_c0_g1_i1.p2 TRINITY_DN37066_c0_g1~~TRINITY_DN37066_c0_g1_i1.p2  ORF type:complete len:181 (-),score=17.28 TRINITY_DN37066_c0_g1_i1:188-730(-)
MLLFFFSSRRRHTRCREVSWARRCVQETERRVHGQAIVDNICKVLLFRLRLAFRILRMSLYLPLTCYKQVTPQGVRHCMLSFLNQFGLQIQSNQEPNVITKNTLSQLPINHKQASRDREMCHRYLRKVSHHPDSNSQALLRLCEKSIHFSIHQNKKQIIPVIQNLLGQKTANQVPKQELQ